MQQVGHFNPAFPADTFGFRNLKTVFYNLEAPRLYEEAMRRGEGEIAAGGALVAETGVHTGRSPKDKFVVEDATTKDVVWWDNNAKMSQAHFDVLLADFLKHAEGKDLFVAGPLRRAPIRRMRVKARVVCEFAWHSLFIRNLLIRPEAGELAGYTADMTIVDLPSFKADPQRHGCRSRDGDRDRFHAQDRADRRHELRRRDEEVGLHLSELHAAGPASCRCIARPMSARTAIRRSSSASPAPARRRSRRIPTASLIGDDEHGWSKDGVFNFEGGCYAKAIKLSQEAEPEIFSTTERFGTVMENVVLDPVTRVPDFDDDSKTENTRIAYPLDFISNASRTGRAGHPKNIVMLTCDAFGVLPPIAKLDGAQAMYHFLSGYTAKVAGTEKGVTEPEATFSACFGHPFLPLHPSVYGNLLRDLIARHHVDCWLVNTGWTGGRQGVGRRMPIRVTRRLLSAALDGSLNNAHFRTDPYFGLAVPDSVPGVEPHILNPVKTWASKADFAETAKNLVAMFHKNFVKFEQHVDSRVKDAAPSDSDRRRIALLSSGGIAKIPP